MHSHINGSTCLVTGGAGFIGSHLVKTLLEQGAQKVYVLDSFDTGVRTNIPANKKVSVLNCRLGVSLAEMKSTVPQDVHYLFHLAAAKHNHTIKSPDTVIESNVLGMQRLLASLNLKTIRQVVFSSSLYAHGGMGPQVLSETDVPTPATLYGNSKLFGEGLIRQFSLETGIPAVSLRYFFVYGPNQFPGLGYKSVIVTNFERLLQGKSPIIKGDGKQALDYVYIDDVVAATLEAAQLKSKGDVFNIGSGKATNILSLVELLGRASGIQRKSEFAEKDWTHGTIRCADVRKSHSTFKWRPKTSLEDGLRITFEWIDSRREAA